MWEFVCSMKPEENTNNNLTELEQEELIAGFQKNMLMGDEL